MIFESTGSWSMGFYGSAIMALVAAAIAFGLKTSRQRGTVVATAAVRTA